MKNNSNYLKTLCVTKMGYLCFFIFEGHLFTMQPISNKTIRLLSRSGLILMFFSMGGSFVMATLSIASGGVEEQTWAELFGMLFLAVLGISVYYLVLAFFGWMEIRRKKEVTPTTN